MALVYRRIWDLYFEFDKKPCDNGKPCDNCQLSHGFLSNSKSKSKLGHCCTIMLYHSQQLSEVLMMALWHFWLIGRKDAGSPQSTLRSADAPLRVSWVEPASFLPTCQRATMLLSNSSTPCCRRIIAAHHSWTSSSRGVLRIIMASESCRKWYNPYYYIDTQ